MKILYVFKHNPFGWGGGAVASRNFLRTFINIYKDSEFDILLCEELVNLIPEDLKKEARLHFHGIKKRSLLSRIISPLSGIMHRYQKDAICYLNSKKYNYCIFDHNSLAGSLVGVAVSNNVETIVVHHNFERDYFRDNNSLIMRLLLLNKVIDNERKAYLNCNYNIFLTQEDKDMFINTYGLPKGKSIVRYIFESSNNSTPQYSTICNPPQTIVITGSLDNRQNLDGLYYFLDNIYQLIPNNYHIIISGQGPSKQLLKKLNDYPQISVIPNPIDMNDVIRKGDIYVCLTRLGGGIKVRITDGLRIGLPVITHVSSSRGYSEFVRKGYMETYDSPQSFIYALKRIENIIANNADLSKEICSYYYTICNYGYSVKVLSDFLK